MATGAGDTISVGSADTVNSIVQTKEFSIGSIIPLNADNILRADKYSSLPSFVPDYIPKGQRINGQSQPTPQVSSDFSFVVISFLLLILTVLTVAGRKSVVSGFSSLSFKRNPAAVLPGTSGVLAWEPVFRNLFTVLSTGLFVAVSLLHTGLVCYDHASGTALLTAIISGSFLAALLLRHFVCIVTAAITGWKNAFREYMNVIYNGWFVNALFLFILNSVILFSSLKNTLPLIIAGLAVTAILLIIRALRLMKIFQVRHISILYFILYLCALEVLPVLVFFKILGIF
jgi:hypothetical protein